MMKAYLSKRDAIINLHQRGFTEDFELFGNNLLWIQGKTFIRGDEFVIAECHRFLDAFGKEVIIFGIITSEPFLYGILMNHYKVYTNEIPAIINVKLGELAADLLDKEENYSDVKYSQ